MNSIATEFLQAIRKDCFRTTDRDSQRREKVCLALLGSVCEMYQYNTF
jgi:hypothetical protein